MKTKRTDWKVIQADYCARVKSLRRIASEHGIFPRGHHQAGTQARLGTRQASKDQGNQWEAIRQQANISRIRKREFSW